MKKITLTLGIKGDEWDARNIIDGLVEFIRKEAETDIAYEGVFRIYSAVEGTDK